ncbi:S8 family serine peptidase [Flindersiella endophytica]
MRFKRIAGFGATVALLVLGLSPSGWAGPGEGTVNGIVAGQPGTRTVTLLTGERVVVWPGSSGQVRVVAAKGRERIGYLRFQTAGHTMVIPNDAARLVASGKLDGRLFDVTELVRAGYDDAKRSDIPLIVRHPKQNGRTALAGVPVSSRRDLPAVAGSAATVAKRDATSAWNRLRTARSVGTIWLDGKRQVSLDESVPQIGAPAAWERGLTGDGIDVAVLDTGIDTTHADLAGKVTAAKDFTGEGTDDLYGHGTHVASTIAGSGAASAGKYRGVAPDAELLNGKVCDGFGSCEESWILAGMQWAAVEQHAKVVNLSLGGTDTPGVDPLEEAVGTLTEQTGTLFVIAAGNLLPWEQKCRVSSPASADAALAVGAVDGEEAIARFSCPGPRVGDNALKPDITAPGVGITAARAANGQLGEPGEDYVSLSGTSMATPHVAGAAAILAQQHPTWTGPQLKAALTGTAEPNAELSAFQQGAGRVAVDQVIDATLVAEPSGLGFGTQLWPHADDTPVSKQLTYRNLGDSALTVRLAAELTGPDGKPAPEGAVELSATSLTIPAGGSAPVTVTSDTDHGGPDGVYSGRITATAAGQSVGTPIGLEKEVESYDLTGTLTGPDGGPAEGLDVVYGLDNDVFELVESGSEPWTLRLPKGRYAVASYLDLEDGDELSHYSALRPLVRLDHDVSVAQDLRAAKPVSVRAERAEAMVDVYSVNYVQYGSGGRRFASYSGQSPGVKIYTAQLGPPVPGKELVSWLDVQGGVPGPDGDFRNTPYIYALGYTKQGAYFTGLDRVVRDRDLVKVVHEQAAQTEGRLANREFFGSPDANSGSWLSFLYDDLPGQVTVFHTPDQPMRWAGFASQGRLGEDGWYESDHFLQQDWRTYRPGRTYRERWNVAAFSPRFTPYVFEPVAPLGRNGDTVQATFMLFGDGNGHGGDSIVDDGWERTMTCDGKPAKLVLDYGVPSFGRYAVPAERSRCSFAVSTSREQIGNSEVSTRLAAKWTFDTEHVPLTDPETIEGWRPIPAWVVGFAPSVDDHNRNHEGPVQFVPVDVTPNPGSKVGTLRAVDVEASTDDGVSWWKAPVLPVGNGRYLAVVATGNTAASFVSLRTKASDSKGNTYEATIVRAYGLSR